MSQRSPFNPQNPSFHFLSITVTAQLIELFTETDIVFRISTPIPSSISNIHIYDSSIYASTMPSLISINDSVSILSSSPSFESSIDYDSYSIIHHSRWYNLPNNLLPPWLRFEMAPIFSSDSEISFKTDVYRCFNSSTNSSYLSYHSHLIILNTYPIPNVFFHFAPFVIPGGS